MLLRDISQTDPLRRHRVRDIGTGTRNQTHFMDGRLNRKLSRRGTQPSSPIGPRNGLVGNLAREGAAHRRRQP
jgi:hypothetical protein